jgi:hypothetical protein
MALSMTDEALVHEIQRTIQDYEFAWEGEHEEVLDFGETRVRTIAVPWYGVDGMAAYFKFDEATVDPRLDDILGEAESGGQRFIWMVGPGAQPADLGDRFVTRGFVPAADWDGMVLEDLSEEIEGNPEVVIEPVSEENAPDFAMLGAFGYEDNPAVYEGRLAAALRYAAIPDKQVLIYLARLGQDVTGYVTMRVEPTGAAYFRNALTLPEYREHGVYLSLSAHRLKVARDAGCAYAVVQANRQTSGPILRKRGFRAMCGFTGYARPDPSSKGW